MGLKKLQNLFKDKKSNEQAKPALKLISTERQSEEHSKRESTTGDKAEIEAYIKSINSKLKDPEMAKKAAQILESWTKKN